MCGGPGSRPERRSRWLNDPMAADPPVSFVMSVCDAASSVERTVGSVLNQSYGDFEFLIVDDGSTDGTADILDTLRAKDSRIRILPQKNLGLTRSLIRGCSEARGELIARQDAGDESLPGRLASLVRVLAGETAVGFACGSTDFSGPGGETLYESRSVAGDGPFGVRERIALGGPGPSHHGAVIFRRGLYERVGGYREAFAMAQDWDLWFRLIEVSRFQAVDELHYRAWVDPHGISMAGKDLQRRYGALAAECHRLRMLGRSDAGPCSEAVTLGGSARNRRDKNPADGFYFIGSLLLENGNPACRKYLLEALRARPRSPKIWCKLMRSLSLRHA